MLATMPRGPPKMKTGYREGEGSGGYGEASGESGAAVSF